MDYESKQIVLKSRNKSSKKMFQKHSIFLASERCTIQNNFDISS